MATRKRYRRLVLAVLLIVAVGLGFGLYTGVQRVRHAAKLTADT
jgi:hypothetical protein